MTASVFVHGSTSISSASTEPFMPRAANSERALFDDADRAEVALLSGGPSVHIVVVDVRTVNVLQRGVRSPGFRAARYAAIVCSICSIAPITSAPCSRSGNDSTPFGENFASG